MSAETDPDVTQDPGIPGPKVPDELRARVAEALAVQRQRDLDLVDA